ncbi:MAG TPA: BTAD domain-containing putative transcriptional regulator [Gemmatimonadales bacterium]|nr:BTAD domain-containing putative transcriptional regulator [Gemmatimonadales bacterium]
MFRLRTFGGLWLERDRQRIPGASPRRLGLLAAVVAAGDHGISRDRLLLLLWPDATESKARHALAQTLYSFRRELGSELIRSDTPELLVDPEQLGSDFADFFDAKARGDVERVVELYSGPFLDGFYIPGADEFERWAEVERTRLRELAMQAMEAAARQATAAGRLEAASAHWRRLSVLGPLNSRIALGYMTSLADAGDVAGAIQYGRAHELSRRQELGAQPDPSVGALLARLTRGEWRSSAPGHAPEPRPSGATLPPAIPRSESAHGPPPAVPSIRRPLRRWIAGVGVAVLAATALWLLPSMLPGRSAFPAGSVVVMADPVDLSGDPGLSKALASAAAVGIQQSRHLTLLSRTRVAEALRRMGRTGDTVLTDSLALEVAARENARAVLALTVAKVSGDYLLTGRLLSPADGADIAVHRVKVDRLDQVIDGLDRLLRQVQASAGDPRRYRDSLPFLPLVTTRSLEALKLFAEGSESWRHAKYDRAQQLFQRSVALDSGFALAHAALGSLYYFINDRPTGDEHFAAALRFRSRLTFREQLSLDSRLAGARGNRAEESRIDGILAERYPSRDTWYNYGSDLMRLGRCKEGIPALQRALGFDSTFANIHVNIATCYKSLGENRLALDAYAAAERADSNALVTNYINHEWGSIYVRLGRYAEAEAAFRRMLALPEANDRARGHRSLAYLDMLQGRYRSAIEHLTTAVLLSRETSAGLSQLRNEALLAEAYLVRGSPKLAGRELDDALKVARAQYVEPGFLALLGRVLVRANRIADAREVLHRLESVLKPDNSTDRSARGLLTAELALARGAPDSAAEAIRNDIDTRLEDWRTPLIGRVLAERGVLDSALAVTAAFARDDAFGQDAQGDWVQAPLAVARIAEALGDSATARAALQTFLDRWKEADPDLAMLRDARLHLARLQREAGR